MTAKLISDNPEPHQFQSLIAPSLVCDTQFHSRIIAGSGLKVLLFVISSYYFSTVSIADLCNTCMLQVLKE